jgi:purine-binding chemotaxis protein CheW
LRGVLRVEGLTPVPCTPALVAGVLNVRGAIVSVLDLAVILGLAASTELTDTAQVLLVESGEALVGLLVDEVVGARDLSLDALDESLSGRDSVRGVADSRIVLLDLKQLLADERFGAIEIEHQYAGV